MKKISVFLLAFFIWLAAANAFALTGEWAAQPQASARLIASNDVGADKKLLVGFELMLQPGWHAYWRSPGDAGLPPQLDWKASENMGSVEMLFPLPKQETLQGLTTYGYQDDVVFPLNIERLDAAQPLKLKAKVNVLVCKDICIPANFDVALDIPPEFTATEEATRLLQKFVARVPRVDDGQGLTLTAAKFTENKIEVNFAGAALNEAELIAEVGDGATLPITATTIEGDKAVAQLGPDIEIKDVLGKGLTFTLVDKTNNQAVEKKLLLKGEAAAMPAPQPIATKTMPMPSLALMVLFAFIGGLILNLMPCVLPVLALKALSFIKHGGGTASGVRLSFLATSAGILFSFFVMAVIIIVLKEIGMSVGWGVQFQQPIFLVFLIAILLVFSASLWGFFEIPLPRFLADRLNWTQGHGNLFKDFLSGAFATLLATPCTAPFLGTAVGFALAAGAGEVLIIFMALGVGLAAPYLLISAFPKMATLLPRPGNWMNNVKRIMALALAATALWLMFVLAVETNQASDKDSAWVDFDRTKIAELVQQDKIVLVDVTAEWCLTCKANKKFVLETDEIKAVLSSPNIVKMKADWTKPDPVIGVFLKDYGRFGIPFNIIYSKAKPDGVILPELLTKETVIKALDEAAAK